MISVSLNSDLRHICVSCLILVDLLLPILTRRVLKRGVYLNSMRFSKWKKYLTVTDLRKNSHYSSALSSLFSENGCSFFSSSNASGEQVTTYVMDVILAGVVHNISVKVHSNSQKKGPRLPRESYMSLKSYFLNISKYARLYTIGHNLFLITLLGLLPPFLLLPLSFIQTWVNSPCRSHLVLMWPLYI